MNKRLASLDILCGLDMFLLAVVGPLFYALDKAFGKIFAPGAAHLLGAWAGPVVEWLAASLLLVAVLYLRREMRQWKKSR